MLEMDGVDKAREEHDESLSALVSVSIRKLKDGEVVFSTPY